MMSALWQKRPHITDKTNSQRSTSMETKVENGNDQDSRPVKVAKLEVPGQVNIDKLKRSIDEVYPDIMHEAHFVPPIHTNAEKYEDQDFAGQAIYIPKPVMDVMPKGRSQDGKQESSCRDDETHQRVLHCLHMIQETDPQAMFVIGQLNYENYLRWDTTEQSLCDSKPVNPPTVRPSQSPRNQTPIKYPVPGDLKKQKQKQKQGQKQNYNRGDFDVLIISRDRGFLIIEIKAVGDVPNSKTDKAVLKKLIQAVNQLKKGREVLKHLASDKNPDPVIRSALALPNVNKNHLCTLLQNNPEVKKDLCDCLNIAENEDEDPLPYCLLADGMPPKESPWLFNADVRNRLLHWWRHVMGERGSEPAMNDDDYKELVARFCGPATFPPLSGDKKSFYRYRSLGEAVADIGYRYQRFVLRPHQLGVLNKCGNLMFLTGPPGTGKTVLLILKACSWLRDDKHVHVVSTWAGSLASSHNICHVLRTSCPQDSERVHFLQMDLKEEGERSLSTHLAAAAVRGPLFLICDEAFGGSEFNNLCTQLKDVCADLHLWAASVYHGYCPPCLDKKKLSEALRTPPAITREVALSDVIKQSLVLKYSTSTTTMPSDGLSPKWILHEQSGHWQGMPGDCVTCGEELGIKIKQLCAAHTPLRYSDVFILTNYFDLVEEVRDSQRNVESEASGLVRGLRNTGVSVTVLKKGDSPAIAQVAAMTGPDAVVVADADTVRGLERKVVVWVQADKGGNSESGEEDFARLDSMSRATALLILVG